MSNPGNNNAPSMIPTITGNPAIDTLLRNAIISLAAGLTGILVTWLNSHGIKDPNLTVVLSGAIVSALVAVAGIVWGIWQTRQSQQAIVNNTIHAALTGEVSQAVAAKATVEQATAIEASPVASVAPAPTKN